MLKRLFTRNGNMNTTFFKNVSIHAERAKLSDNGQICLYGVHINFLPGAPVPALLDLAPPVNSISLPGTGDNEAPVSKHEEYKVVIDSDLVPDGEHKEHEVVIDSDLVPVNEHKEHEVVIDKDVEMMDIDDPFIPPNNDSSFGKVFWPFPTTFYF